MLKNLKTTGFNLEDAHVTDFQGIETLIGPVTLGFVCAVNDGKSIQCKMPDLFKLSANLKPKLSIIRAGLVDHMNGLLNNNLNSFHLLLKFLSSA